MSKIENIIKLLEKGKIEEVQPALEHVNTNEISTIGSFNQNILAHAIQGGYDGLCKIIIPKMSDESLNQRNEMGQTILHLAVGNKMIEVCRLLVDRMSKEAIEAKNLVSGCTALHSAIFSSYEDQDICKLLIAKGCKLGNNFDKFMNDGGVLTSWFEHIGDAVKLVDKIGEQKIFEGKIEISADWIDPLCKRILDKLTQEFKVSSTVDQDYEKCIAYIKNIKEQLPEQFYLNCINSLKQMKDKTHIEKETAVAIFEENELLMPETMIEESAYLNGEVTDQYEMNS